MPHGQQHDSRDRNQPGRRGPAGSGSNVPHPSSGERNHGASWPGYRRHPFSDRGGNAYGVSYDDEDENAGGAAPRN